MVENLLLIKQFTKLLIFTLNMNMNSRLGKLFAVVALETGENATATLNRRERHCHKPYESADGHGYLDHKLTLDFTRVHFLFTLLYP